MLSLFRAMLSKSEQLLIFFLKQTSNTQKADVQSNDFWDNFGQQAPSRSGSSLFAKVNN